MNEPDISPLARRLAEENNVNWRDLAGSGAGGKVVERDVLEYLARVMAGEEAADPTTEPLPDGMDAWPEEDVRSYNAGLQQKQTRSGIGLDTLQAELSASERQVAQEGAGASRQQQTAPSPTVPEPDPDDLLEFDDDHIVASGAGSADEETISEDIFLFDDESEVEAEDLETLSPLAEARVREAAAAEREEPSAWGSPDWQDGFDGEIPAVGVSLEPEGIQGEAGDTDLFVGDDLQDDRELLSEVEDDALFVDDDAPSSWGAEGSPREEGPVGERWAAGAEEVGFDAFEAEEEPEGAEEVSLAAEEPEDSLWADETWSHDAARASVPDVGPVPYEGEPSAAAGDVSSGAFEQSADRDWQDLEETEAEVHPWTDDVEPVRAAETGSVPGEGEEPALAEEAEFEPGPEPEPVAEHEDWKAVPSAAAEGEFGPASWQAWEEPAGVAPSESVAAAGPEGPAPVEEPPPEEIAASEEWEAEEAVLSSVEEESAPSPAAEEPHTVTEDASATLPEVAAASELQPGPSDLEPSSPLPASLPLAGGQVPLVSYGVLLRRHLDLTALAEAQLAVSRELVREEPIPPTAFLLRAAAKTLKAIPLEHGQGIGLAVIGDIGFRVRRIEEAANMPFLRLLELAGDPHAVTAEGGTPSLVVADMSALDVDEAVLNLGAPVLALGRILYDNQQGRYRSTLSLSGEVPLEVGSHFLSRVAELLDSPVQLVL